MKSPLQRMLAAWLIAAAVPFSMAGWVAYMQVPRLLAPSYAGHVIAQDPTTGTLMVCFQSGDGQDRTTTFQRTAARRTTVPPISLDMQVLEIRPGVFEATMRNEAAVFWLGFVSCITAGLFAASTLIGIHRPKP
jgi:hypothetical protein